MDWQAGIGMYMLIHPEQVANKDPLCKHRGLYSIICGDLYGKRT